MLPLEKVSSYEGSKKEEGRVHEGELGCEGGLLDLVFSEDCSNPANEVHKVSFGLVLCEKSSRLEFLGEEQVELWELDGPHLGDESETEME